MWMGLKYPLRAGQSGVVLIPNFVCGEEGVLDIEERVREWNEIPCSEGGKKWKCISCMSEIYVQHEAWN